MQIVNFVSNLFTTKGFVGLVEIFVVILQIIYVLFAFMLTRQIKIMNSNFKTPAAPFFTFLGFLNFIASVVLAGFAILAL